MLKKLSKPIQKYQTRKKNWFPWEIAVYSTKSAKVCRDRALKLLHHYNIPSTKITVFFSNPAEESNYKKTLKRGTYHTIVSVPESELLENVVSQYYRIGSQVVHIHDSVKGFLQYGHTVLKSLLPLLQQGFKLCEREQSFLWGLYPDTHLTALRPTITTDLKKINPCFWGCINLGTEFAKITVPEKAAYERVILYFKKAGTVIRLNFVTVLCDDIHPIYESQRLSLKACEILVNKYPDFLTLQKIKDGGYELLLRSLKHRKDTKDV